MLNAILPSMNNDRKLVYSTEHGSIAKPDKDVNKKRKKNAAQGSTIKNPAKQGIRIRRETKGRGGKSVCVIDGFSLSDEDLKGMLKKLKSHLGTGGAIKDGCIEIQGDHRIKLLALLEKEGIKAKLAGG